MYNYTGSSLPGCDLALEAGGSKRVGKKEGETTQKKCTQEAQCGIDDLHQLAWPVDGCLVKNAGCIF